jgi:PGM1 C-terminal domain
MTVQAESPATLGALSEEERYDRFDGLQERMADVWRTMRVNEPGESVVVVPSVTVDRVGERSGTLTQAFEERFLSLLLPLRQPRLRMIYVTSLPISPSIVDAYVAKLEERRGIVEEFITGVEVRSPSVQLRVTPTGAVELLSTHDQLLGWPSGQTYLGCRFPADFAYARAISADAETIGARLAREWVLGRFALDFVVVKDTAGSWTSYAIELNLRKGGTTHPFLTLQFLTDGRYDPTTALFLTPAGREKHLVATDHFESDSLRGLSLDDLFDIVARHGLHLDQARQTGLVFHMISCLTEHGMVGLTAVGDSPAAADATYHRAERILLDEAEAALVDSDLPPI